MVARRQSNWPGPRANHKEAHGLIKEQHMFDFLHSHTDDIWQVKGTHDAHS
jgi:hypothetical protein